MGDGNFHKKASLTITNTDQELISKINSCLPSDLRLVMSKSRSGFAPTYRIVGREKWLKNSIRSFMSEKGLLGCKALDKFIPEECLFESVYFRSELLRGLMDTDGFIFAQRSGNPRIQYYSTSKKLADGVGFLVHSLGGTAIVRKRKFGDNDNGRIVHHRNPLYVVDIILSEINPFGISRKADKFKPGKPQRLISKVEYVGRKQCQCIKVEAKNNLYLTEHCIVTHNTFDDAVCIFDEAQNATMMQLKLFLTRFGENSKIIVTGDPTQSDLKGDIALVEVVNRLQYLEGVGVIEFKANSIVRHPLVGKIIDKLGGV